MKNEHMTFDEISAYSDGHKSEDFSAHLKKCVKCSAVLSEINKTKELTSSLKNLKIESDLFDAEIMRRIKKRRLFKKRHILPLSAAAAFLIILFSGLVNEDTGKIETELAVNTSPVLDFSHVTDEVVSSGELKSMLTAGKILSDSEDTLIIESTYSEYRALMKRLRIPEENRYLKSFNAMHLSSSNGDTVKGGTDPYKRVVYSIKVIREK
ncbi:MAG: hypothetical protein KA015_03155 [Spirochaetes bacterium]|nr:hypothetical protein [Spirochaetota bacterium]